MSVACEHENHGKPDRSAVEAGLEAGKARCLAANQRWTPQRERALELLLEAGGPVKAYDLLAQFKTGGQTAPPTVYRALDALAALGLVHRIASLNAYTACHVGHGDHAASFLICDCCGAAEEFAAPTAAVFEAIRAGTRFNPDYVAVEAHGRCQACSA